MGVICMKLLFKPILYLTVITLSFATFHSSQAMPPSPSSITTCDDVDNNTRGNSNQELLTIACEALENDPTNNGNLVAGIFNSLARIDEIVVDEPRAKLIVEVAAIQMEQLAISVENSNRDDKDEAATRIRERLEALLFKLEGTVFDQSSENTLEESNTDQESQGTIRLTKQQNIFNNLPLPTCDDVDDGIRGASDQTILDIACTALANDTFNTKNLVAGVFNSQESIDAIVIDEVRANLIIQIAAKQMEQLATLVESSQRDDKEEAAFRIRERLDILLIKITDAEAEFIEQLITE